MKTYAKPSCSPLNSLDSLGFVFAQTGVTLNLMLTDNFESICPTQDPSIPPRRTTVEDSIFNIDVTGFTPTELGTLEITVCGDIGNENENYFVDFEGVNISGEGDEDLGNVGGGPDGDCTCDLATFNLLEFFTLEEFQTLFEDGNITVEVYPEPDDGIACVSDEICQNDTFGNVEGAEVRITLNIDGVQS